MHVTQLLCQDLGYLGCNGFKRMLLHKCTLLLSAALATPVVADMVLSTLVPQLLCQEREQLVGTCRVSFLSGGGNSCVTFARLR